LALATANAPQGFGYQMTREVPMRVFAALIAVLSMIGFAMPAQALGMQFCDDIKDDQARMACLQQHISHLEETILALGGRVAALENALQKMLPADANYKLKSVSLGRCLGAKNDEVAMVSCDNPDAWSVMSGAPVKKLPKTPAPADEQATSAAGSAATADTSHQVSNPCKNLDQDACAAKADTCAWKADKNKCGRKDS
jgi:hypothetical protein